MPRGPSGLRHNGQQHLAVQAIKNACWTLRRSTASPPPPRFGPTVATLGTARPPPPLWASLGGFLSSSWACWLWWCASSGPWPPGARRGPSWATLTGFAAVSPISGAPRVHLTPEPARQRPRIHDRGAGWLPAGSTRRASTGLPAVCRHRSVPQRHCTTGPAFRSVLGGFRLCLALRGVALLAGSPPCLTPWGVDPRRP